MSTNAAIINCHNYGLLQQKDLKPEDGLEKCGRCMDTLGNHQRIKALNIINYTLTLMFAVIAFFTLANIYPVIPAQAVEHGIPTSLFASTRDLLASNIHLLAALIFVSCFGMVLMHTSGLLFILLLAQKHILLYIMTSACMLKALISAILISVLKLSSKVMAIPAIAQGTVSLLTMLPSMIFAHHLIKDNWEPSNA